MMSYNIIQYITCVFFIYMLPCQFLLCKGGSSSGWNMYINIYDLSIIILYIKDFKTWELSLWQLLTFKVTVHNSWTNQR